MQPAPPTWKHGLARHWGDAQSDGEGIISPTLNFPQKVYGSLKD